MTLDAQLLRCLGGNRFCVALRDTNAVICIECPSVGPGFDSVGPYSPLQVKVELGEYQVQQGVFKNSCMVAPYISARPIKTTSYKRVRC